MFESMNVCMYPCVYVHMHIFTLTFSNDIHMNRYMASYDGMYVLNRTVDRHDFMFLVPNREASRLSKR